MFWWAECNIRIFANFRQNHLFSAGDKTTVFQNDRFDNPDSLVPYDSSDFPSKLGKEKLNFNSHTAQKTEVLATGRSKGTFIFIVPKNWLVHRFLAVGLIDSPENQRCGCIKSRKGKIRVWESDLDTLHLMKVNRSRIRSSNCMRTFCGTKSS